MRVIAFTSGCCERCRSFKNLAWCSFVFKWCKDRRLRRSLIDDDSGMMGTGIRIMNKIKGEAGCSRMTRVAARDAPKCPMIRRLSEASAYAEATARQDGGTGQCSMIKGRPNLKIASVASWRLSVKCGMASIRILRISAERSDESSRKMHDRAFWDGWDGSMAQVLHRPHARIPRGQRSTETARDQPGLRLGLP
jgi:hypothetical protein